MTVLKNNQNEYNFYLKQLTVTVGAINDLEQHFLFSELSLTEGDNSSMWLTWLKDNGASSDNLSDAWREFLEDSGYTGGLQDMQDKYFADNS